MNREDGKIVGVAGAVDGPGEGEVIVFDNKMSAGDIFLVPSEDVWLLDNFVRLLYIVLLTALFVQRSVELED